MQTLILFIYGTCLGSWLMAMATRSTAGTSALYPPSHCDTCQTPLPHWQLLPILSYLSLRGRCFYCHTPIPVETLGVEITLGLLLTTLTPANGLILLWFGLWTFAALCDAQAQSFPGWVSWSALLIVLIGQPLALALSGGLLFVAIQLLWPYWKHPWIGDGDLEMMLSYGLLFGITATAQWLLLASLLARLTWPHQSRSAFLPYLLVSAIGWWLWR